MIGRSPNTQKIIHICLNEGWVAIRLATAHLVGCSGKNLANHLSAGQTPREKLQNLTRTHLNLFNQLGRPHPSLLDLSYSTASGQERHVRGWYEGARTLAQGHAHGSTYTTTFCTNTEYAPHVETTFKWCVNVCSMYRLWWGLCWGTSGRSWYHYNYKDYSNNPFAWFHVQHDSEK